MARRKRKNREEVEGQLDLMDVEPEQGEKIKRAVSELNKAKDELTAARTKIDRITERIRTLVNEADPAIVDGVKSLRCGKVVVDLKPVPEKVSVSDYCDEDDEAEEVEGAE